MRAKVQRNTEIPYETNPFSITSFYVRLLRDYISAAGYLTGASNLRPLQNDQK